MLLCGRAICRSNPKVHAGWAGVAGTHADDDAKVFADLVVKWLEKPFVKFDRLFVLVCWDGDGDVVERHCAALALKVFGNYIKELF
jgi:hypothetical protein